MSASLRAAALAGALSLALSACGSGDDGKPALSRPTTSSGARTTTAPAKPRPPAPPPTATNPPAQGDSGGTPSPPGSSGGTPPQAAQRNFQQYCETHPGACGD